MEKKNETVVYRLDESTILEVLVEEDTLWLTQQQIADLFGVKQPAISKHLNNIFRDGELDKDSVHSILEYTASDGKVYSTQFYNLDAILSVGYRVNSRNATQFRIWANQILKDYLLRGYAINTRLEAFEQRVDKELFVHEQRIRKNEEQIGFFIRSALPPVEGVFCDGQIFDAYVFASQLVKSAKSRVVLMDNYIDETVLLLLSKRNENVAATIITRQAGQMLKQDLTKHNTQYLTIDVKVTDRVHDRFLVIDDNVYHIGASLKDLGKKLFAFSKMELGGEELIRMFEAYPNVQ